ncbi:hypothetical protein DSECCO2_289610 [anaerobic digester metagenome]
MTLKELDKYLDENICMLTEEDIHAFNNMPGQGGDINNVIRLINEHCFGIFGFEDSYELYYITNIPHLKGILIKISNEIESHNMITLAFAKTVKYIFPESNLDMLDVANIFQQHKRAYFSKIGDNIVFDSVEYSKKYGEGTAIFLHNPIDITHFDKLSFYQDAFKEVDINKVRIDKSRDNKIYILFNERNGLFKIGRSINANHREKTLQGEDPHIEMIACWVAPEYVEKELHEKFKEKRTRGEWFSLDLDHLEEINIYMKKYR